jgi:hypothetical protein
MENNFLKGKYDLHNAPEVESAAERTKARTGEEVPQNSADRIQNYLDRFNEILDREDPEKRERGVEAIKKVLYDKFVIKPEEIPEGYFDNQRRLAREQGHGDIEIAQEQRDQLSEVVVADQKSSLDTWVDYLSSQDATYPDWLKYYAVRSIVGMGEYDKAKKAFTKRSAGTTKPFPDLNREALAYVLDAIEKKYKGEKVNLAALEAEDQAQFDKLLDGENFAKLYAWAIEKVTPASIDRLAITKGKWVKYDQNSDHMPLVESLQGHGTGWCTAGESTAQMQLTGGDFYVYYSEDEDGNPTVPRAAIRMREGNIGEVRGVAAQQNLDPYINAVVQNKLKEFPDGAQYEKKAHDMKTLTDIDRKTKAGAKLTKKDLVFLYEMDASIEGFGYDRDPRIEELRDQRSSKEDMLTLFECTENQIAHFPSEINENTKAYVGAIAGSVRNPETNDMDLDPGDRNIFQKIGHLEHIYTSFPEGRIRKEEIEIGGKDAEVLIKEMRGKNINISGYAEDEVKSKDFITLEKAEAETLIRLKIGDLGFPKNKYPTTDEVYKRIEELGLELCPAETGPHYRLKYVNQPLNEGVYIGMKQITARGGDPSVFDVYCSGGGLWLDGSIADPDDGWNDDDKFMFRLRKLKNLES